MNYYRKLKSTFFTKYRILSDCIIVFLLLFSIDNFPDNCIEFCYNLHK